ncbi:MAG: hypothetical protein COB07_02115 [Sulfurovum sp.]|nr:MAG: hypothetical protein COB07_02115 [Sulfurovum sp.]
MVTIGSGVTREIKDIVLTPFIVVGATNKIEVDGFTHYTKEVLDMLQKKGLIDIDEVFIKKFGMLAF